MKNFTAWILRFRVPVIILIAAVSVFFAAQMKNMKMDPDITNSLPDNLDAKRLYDKMGEIFPSKEFIFLGIESDSIWSTEVIAFTDSLTRAVESFPEVYQVISPTNISVISGTPEGMLVEEALQSLPVTESEIEAYRQRLFQSDLALGNLIAADQSAFGIMIFLAADADNTEFSEKLIAFTDGFNDNMENISLFMAGKGISSYYIGIGMQKDMGTFFGGGILLIFVLLIVIFRNVRGVALPILVVILSVIWTLGLMVFLGFPLSHSITILPILVMAISVADSIHILTHYMHNARSNSDPRETVLATMEDMNSPVIMTSLTTMAGFISLGTVSAESIMELGLFSAAGVFFALILSLTMVPALLSMLKVPKMAVKEIKSTKNSEESVEKDPFIARLAYGTVSLFSRRFVISALALVLVSAFGFSRLKHDSSSIENFPEDHPVRVAYNKVNSQFAGSTSFQIMFEAREDDAMKDPRVLRDMDELRNFILSREHVGDTQSLADFIKKFNKVLNGDDPAYFTIPPDTVEFISYWEDEEEATIEKVPGRELIAQYLTLYEMSGKPDDMANLVDYGYRNAKMSIFLKDDRASVLRSLDRDIEEFLSPRFAGQTVAVTGMAKLILVVDELIVKGQIYSIITSLLLVWLITSLFFRSFTLGFFNTLPLFFALVLNFVIMGLFSIPINLETMITSSIAIGVGVDYAIHFIYRFRVMYSRTADHDEAFRLAFRDSGMAIVFNSFVVASGFAIIGLSQFVAVSYMGILITLTMLTTAFGALIILPLIFTKFKPKIFNKYLISGGRK